jgi:hypothetical protein
VVCVCVCVCLRFGGEFLGLGVPLVTSSLGESLPEFSKTLHDFGALDLGVGFGGGFKFGLDVLPLGLAEEDVARDSLLLGSVVVALRLGRLLLLLLLLGLLVGLGRLGGLVGHQGSHLLLKNLNALGNKLEGHRHRCSSVVVGCLMDR